MTSNRRQYPHSHVLSAAIGSEAYLYCNKVGKVLDRASNCNSSLLRLNLARQQASMRRKKHKHTRRSVSFYKINYGFREPFKVQTCVALQA